MEVLIGTLVFIFGTLIGSFLNVCIYRLPLERSIITKPSSCASCGARLNALDLIPILSYALLLGRCRRCKARISVIYPTVEALTGTLYLLLYIKFGLDWVLPVYAALISLLIVAAFIDMRHMIIPNGIVIAGLIVGAVQLSAAVFTGVFGLWHSYVIGFFAGGLPLLIIAFLAKLVLKREAMGGGDIKLMAFCGLIIGWKLIIPAYLTGFIAGALIMVLLIAAGRKKRGDEIPFGPFLALGVTVSLFIGNELIDWYLGLL
ncbi:MAG: prepilin peptidase [Christensenellales bacterium]